MHPSHTPASSTPAILLLEQKPEVQIILYRLLRDFTRAHDIVLVTDADQVLAQIALRPVVLLITEFATSETNGIELAKAVKLRSPETHIVLIAGQILPERERQAYLAGVDYYLPKPFRLEHLEQIVHASIA